MESYTYDAPVTRRRRASGNARSPTKSPARKPTLSKSPARKPLTARPYLGTGWQDADLPQSASDVEYISPLNLSPNVAYNRASARMHKAQGHSDFPLSLCDLCSLFLVTVLALFITIPLTGWPIFKPVAKPPCEINVIYTSFPDLCTWATQRNVPVSADNLIRDTQFLSDSLFELLDAIPYVSRMYQIVEQNSVWISKLEALSDDIRVYQNGFPSSGPPDTFGTIISLRSHLRTVPLKSRLFESGYAPYLKKLGENLERSTGEIEGGIAAYKRDQWRDTLRRRLAPYIAILDIYSCRHHYIHATQRVIDETRYDLINLVNNTEVSWESTRSCSAGSQAFQTHLSTQIFPAFDPCTIK